MNPAKDHHWSGRAVAVTGAGGFIGSRLAGTLAALGASVRALVHYRGDGSRGLLDHLDAERRNALDVVSGDLRDGDWVRRSLRDVTDVFHLGALVGIPYSYLGPRDVVATNVGGTLNVLEAVRDLGAQRLVQTSTSEVYGTAQTTPMDETHPLSAQSPYAASKVAADQIALSFHRSFGVPVAIARPFNTYGPGQSARAVVPTIISQALVRDAVHLGSADSTRDLVHVDDTVGGLLAIGSCDDAVGQVFNIATGVETSIRDIVDTVSRIVGRELGIREDPDRVRPANSEVDRLVGDAQRLRASSGWEARMTLDAGLRETVAWIEDHPDSFEPDAYHV